MAVGRPNNPVKQARVYLDHAATTPILPQARDAMVTAFDGWANASSPHSEGRSAKAALEAARSDIANALDWDGDIIFTSGSSEAIRMALLPAQQAFAGATEHDAVFAVMKERGEAKNILPVSSRGYIDSGAISAHARYAIQSVNSETGVQQHFAEIAQQVQHAGAIWICDCSQSAGKIALPPADIIIISAHKLGGPPGVGALLTRDLALLSAGGGHEQGYRRGTENLPAIAGFAAALREAPDWMDEAVKLRDWLDTELASRGAEIVAADSNRLATIASYRMPGVSANSQLISFDSAAISVSAGSACSSGTLKTSHVLEAMGWPAKDAGEVIRVSIGPQTKRAELEHFVSVWTDICNRAKTA